MTHSFEAQQEGDLSLRKGDVLRLSRADFEAARAAAKREVASATAVHDGGASWLRGKVIRRRRPKKRGGGEADGAPAAAGSGESKGDDDDRAASEAAAAAAGVVGPSGAAYEEGLFPSSYVREINRPPAWVRRVRARDVGSLGALLHSPSSSSLSGSESE